MLTLPPSPWKEFLQALDAKMTEVCTLPCFGGFAVTLEYGISRTTSDIDVLDVAPPRVVDILIREAHWKLDTRLTEENLAYFAA